MTICLDVLYKFVECVRCSNQSLNDIKGVVVEERRNAIVILTINGALKTVVKSACWFYVRVGDTVYLVSGTKIVGRREERARRCRGRWMR